MARSPQTHTATGRSSARRPVTATPPEANGHGPAAMEEPTGRWWHEESPHSQPAAGGRSGEASAAAPGTAAAAPSVFGGWGALLRPAMAWSLEGGLGLMRAAEELQRAQLESLHLATARQEDVQQRLASCGDFPEMMGLQAELMRFAAANTMQYTQRCMDVAMHANAAFARSLAGAANGGRNAWLRNAFQAFQGGIHTGFKPLDDLFSAPLQRELFSQHQDRRSAQAAG